MLQTCDKLLLSMHRGFQVKVNKPGIRGQASNTIIEHYADRSVNKIVFRLRVDVYCIGGQTETDMFTKTAFLFVLAFGYINSI